MLSACMEYKDILSDKLRGAHPSPPKGMEPDTHPLFLGGSTAGYCGLKILILSSGGYVIRLNKKESGIRGAIPPPLGRGWGWAFPLGRAGVGFHLGRAGVGFHLGRAGVGYHLNNSLGSWPNSSLKHLVK